MALSGSFENYPTRGFGLYCTWSASQSVTGNYSDVTLNVYLKYYSLYVGARADSTISINGTSETYTAAAISEDSNASHTTLLKSKTVRVAHSTNGTKTGVALSASWRFSGTYSGVSIGTITASTTIDLNSIDRSAPTVSFSTSGITAYGFKISATSSATSDIWQYSTNDGSTWTQFSTTAGTSASVTLSSLSPNTSYTVRVRARKKSNQVYGTSGSSTVKTLGGAVVNGASTLTADAPTVKITVNATVYNASYKYTLTLKNGSTTYLTISGLTWTAGTADRSITLTATQRTTLLNCMASMKSFTGTFMVATYNGNTQIGSSSSKTATVQTTAENSAPTLSAFTYADTNITTTGITGNNQVLVQNHSTLTVTPGTATAKNGASISNYTAACNGDSVSNSTGAVLNVGKVAASGNVTVTLTVTDSRGYTASVSKSVTVIPYANPKASSVTLRRTNDIEPEMQLKFSGSISAISVSSVQKNSLQYVRYRYKKTSASSYGSYYSIIGTTTTTGTSFSYTNLQLCNLDANASYDFHLQIQDRLLSASSLDLYFVVPQGTPLVALRKGKVGINTPAPAAALHVVGDTILDGKVTAGALTATSLSGTLAASNISGTLPVNKGGTGSTTIAGAISMLINSEAIKPNTVETGANIYYPNFGINLHNSDVIGLNGLFFQDSADSALEGLNFYRSTTTWDRLYAYGGVLYFAPNQNASTHPGTRYTVYHTGNTVALGNGGTGATSAAAARTNLGITCTSLYSGTLSSGSITFNYGSYKAYIIAGNPNTSAAKMSIIVPKGMITTSNIAWQIADEGHYRSFNLKYSGSTVTLAIAGGYGSITNVYGVN